MKALFASVCLLSAKAAWAQAETAPPVDDLARAEGGIALHWGPQARSYGLGGAAEIKYYPIQRVGLGVRFDGGVRAGGNVGTESSALQLGTGVAALGKGEVFLTLGTLRPFVGAGAGVYSLAGQGLATGSGGSGATTDRGTYFGVAPQLGLDFGTMRITATYHALFGAEYEVPDGTGVRSISRNYLGLDLLFVAWRLPR